jgi:DNA-binding transcriptional LysR family regulator
MAGVMELKQIQYFETVYQTKSLSKAAKELLVTQQCVSKIIRNLEQELGAQLFYRSSCGVTPTEQGSYFHDQATIILKTQDTILQHFSSLKDNACHTLNVGISHGLRFFFDEQCFLGFQREYPDIQLHITDLWNPQTEDQVITHSIDIGFTLASVKYPELTTVHIWKEPVYCIVNHQHPLFDRTTLELEDVLDEKIVLADENYNSYYDFQDFCESNGKHPNIIKASDLMSIYEYVLHNQAVGFTLRSYSDILHFQGIRHIPLNDPNIYWDICLIYQDCTKPSMIGHFVRYIQNYVAQKGQHPSSRFRHHTV